MDLFKLLGTISINNSDANEALEKTSKTADQTKSKLSNAFSSIGKGAAKLGTAVAAGVGAAVAGVSALATAAISSYADYEQLVGGVETLFKDSADRVKEYAEQAYKTAGLSANEYMETVTGFSASLLQSLGGDTAKAAEYADQAIIDMADNANKMGSDISSIQTAYQGFAKQNYTMLDNLKLGYGGTQQEMYRLMQDAEKLGAKFNSEFYMTDKGTLVADFADITEAIHVVQTEMGITGTTAKEASSTISGSISSMKSSWENLLTAMVSDDLPFEEYANNFVDSATTAVNNLIPRIITALGGVVQLIDQLAPVIIAKIPELFNQLLPAVIEAAIGLLTGVANVLPTLLNTIVSLIPTAVQGVKQIFATLVQIVPQLIQSLISVLPEMLPMILETLISMIVMLCGMLPQVIQPIIDYLPFIMANLITALLENLPVLIEGLITLVIAVVRAIPQLMQGIVDAAPTVISLFVSSLLGCLPQLIVGLGQLIWELLKALFLLFKAYMQYQIVGAVAIVMGLWNAIKGVFAPVGDFFKEVWSKVSEAFAPVVDFFKDVWNKVCEVFAPVVDFFKVMFENAWIAVKAVWSVVAKVFEIYWQLIRAVFTPVINFYKTIFEGAWNAVKAIWSKASGFFADVWNAVKEPFMVVSSWFKEIFTTAWNNIKNVFSGVKTFFTGIWDDIKTAFSGLGTKIGDAISSSVKMGINAVIGNAENIINGFFKMINGAIDIINKIPNVEVSKLAMIEFTRLAKGGVVDKPTPAVFGEDGAEAVVPLENNTGWLNKVAMKLHEFSTQYNGGLDRELSFKSIELQQMQVSELQTLNMTADKILAAVLMMDENMGGHLREALNGVSFDVNKREFARLVKGTI